MNKCISILGSTGSIGTQALEVAEAHQISIHALSLIHISEPTRH